MARARWLRRWWAILAALLPLKPGEMRRGLFFFLLLSGIVGFNGILVGVLEYMLFFHIGNNICNNHPI